MDIRFTCPRCTQDLTVDQAGAGTDVPCPTCGISVMVPRTPPVAARPMEVIVTDVQISFRSMFDLTVKWLVALILAAFGLGVLGLLVFFAITVVFKT